MISASEARKATKSKFSHHINMIEKLIIESAEKGDKTARYKGANIFDEKLVKSLVDELKLSGFNAKIVIASTTFCEFTCADDFILIDWSGDGNE